MDHECSIHGRRKTRDKAWHLQNKIKQNSRGHELASKETQEVVREKGR